MAVQSSFTLRSWAIMIGLFAAVPLQTWEEPTPQPALTGLATYYRRGLMEDVAAYREMDLAGYVGGVALNRAGDLGRIVWLEHDGEVTGPYLVVDCARRTHYPKREQQRYVVEVPYEVAKAWKSLGHPEPVIVRFIKPSPAEMNGK